MLTRCPACETHFRVTAEQLKARSGRVRCGECQHVFNALDSLIEEPMAVIAPAVAELPQSIVPSLATAEGEPAAQPETEEPPAPELTEAAASGTDELVTTEPGAIEPIPGDADVPDWSETFPEPPPPQRRWPWVIGSVVALTTIALQAALAFRVELAVLWPEARPALVTLCDFAGCDVGLPTRVALVSIEASDLYPDKEHTGRLALTATLKNRAPFTQQFPHLELTLTDTADKAIARRVLAPTEYLPPKTSFTNGMSPGADIIVAVGVDPSEMTASGYRLYLFYP